MHRVFLLKYCLYTCALHYRFFFFFFFLHALVFLSSNEEEDAGGKSGDKTDYSGSSVSMQSITNISIVRSCRNEAML